MRSRLHVEETVFGSSPPSFRVHCPKGLRVSVCAASRH